MVRWFMRLNTLHAAALVSVLIAAVSYAVSRETWDKTGTAGFSAAFIAIAFGCAAIVFGVAGFGKAVSALALGLFTIGVIATGGAAYILMPLNPTIEFGIGAAIALGGAFGLGRTLRARQLQAERSVTHGDSSNETI